MTEVNVTKVWDDNDNQDGVRPVNVTVELFADGVKINETVLNEGNGWKFTFTDLPVKNNGQVINYTVNETAIANYTAVITNETAYNWTVINNHTPLVTEVNVTKVWDDNNNQDDVRPVNVTVELFADGVKINETILNEGNGWKFTFPNLPVYKDGVVIVYTVNETPVANYTVNITVNADGTFVINNTHVPLVTELNVTKVWNDSDNQDGVRPVNVTVYLFANGNLINQTVLTADNDWKHTFPDLDVYENGQVINYTIAEVAVTDYTVVITNDTAYDWTVTNTYVPNMTEVNVTKVWDDNNNQDGVRPVNVTVVYLLMV
jgi:nitrogen fixation protein